MEFGKNLLASIRHQDITKDQMKGYTSLQRVMQYIAHIGTCNLTSIEPYRFSGVTSYKLHHMILFRVRSLPLFSDPRHQLILWSCCYNTHIYSVHPPCPTGRGWSSGSWRGGTGGRGRGTVAGRSPIRGARRCAAC